MLNKTIFIMKRTCKHCNTEFENRYSDFCSQSCSMDYTQSLILNQQSNDDQIYAD